MAKSKKPGGSKRAGYRVGYGKPPKHSQFKKGVSGNKRGRRKSSMNRNTLTRPISRAQAIVLSLAAEAHAGDPHALFRLLNWIDRMDSRRP